MNNGIINYVRVVWYIIDIIDNFLYNIKIFLHQRLEPMTDFIVKYFIIYKMHI